MKALLDGAQQFALQRWQASQEAQYNEAALAIEEGMREAEYTLRQIEQTSTMFLTAEQLAEQHG
jgi:hypothetical protein